jgi:hypothetical protein
MKAASTFAGLVTAAVLALPAGALAVPVDSTGPVDAQPLSAPRAESPPLAQQSSDGDGTGTFVVVLIAGGAAAAAGCAGYTIARMPRMRGQRQRFAG